MARARKKNRGADSHPRFEISIEKLVYGGDGLGRHGGKVVFVPFSAPGDVADVRAVESRKGYSRAVITRLLTPGPGRAAPACPHFGACGGCQWQHIEYGVQAETKRRILEETFHHRFPETRRLEVSMRASPAPYAYRSRARIQVRGTGSLSKAGFFRHGSHAVEDVAQCPLFTPPLNEALSAVRGAQAQGRLPASVHEIELAASADGTWEAAGAEPAAGYAQPSSGTGVTRQAGEFVFHASPSAFFQANEFMLEELIRAALGLATGGKSALDLYAGAGLFSLPLARRYGRVTAVESSPAAHDLCVRNIARAGLENLEAICADVLCWMEAVGGIAPLRLDLVLLDPPRTGAGIEVMHRLAEWAPEKIIYVSCDLQTLVRDLAALPARDYRIDSLTGLDLFPQTYHFETVAGLVRR